MTKKKNRQRLEDSLSEAINPKPKIDRRGTVNSLLDSYRPEPAKNLGHENAPAETEPPANFAPAPKTVPASIIEAPAEIAPATETVAPLNFVAPAKSAAGSKNIQRLVQTAPAVKIAPPAESEAAGGYTRFNNYVLDKVFRTLKPLEQVTLLRLLRLSHGFGKSFCKVSMPTLASSCNAGETQIRVALRSLEAAGHISRGETDYANPDQTQRGAVYRILLEQPGTKSAAPSKSAAPAKSEPNKEKDLKESFLNRPKHLDVGKSAAQEFEIRPLDEQGREAALAELSDFAGDDTLNDFQKWYTAEDWHWLTEKLNLK